MLAILSESLTTVIKVCSGNNASNLMDIFAQRPSPSMLIPQSLVSSSLFLSLWDTQTFYSPFLCFSVFFKISFARCEPNPTRLLTCVLLGATLLTAPLTAEPAPLTVSAVYSIINIVGVGKHRKCVRYLFNF